MQATRRRFVCALLAVVVLFATSLPSFASEKKHGHGSGSHHSSGHRSTGKSVHVRSYRRKDGTTVHAHNRRSPNTAGTGESKTAPKAKEHAAAAPAAGHHESTYCLDCARDSHGKIKRSPEDKDEFRKAHPCPSTGRTSGSCPGYVIDHVQALKHGGADAPSNMQWQTVQDAKAKDKWE